MIIHKVRVPMVQGVEVLVEALSDTGFTLDDIEVILECELDTSHVAEYIAAVRRNRMN
jgi:hypothetical protein